jgi:hypothetical protein
MGLVLGMPEKRPMTELASKRMGDSFSNYRDKYLAGIERKPQGGASIKLCLQENGCGARIKLLMEIRCTYLEICCWREHTGSN